MRIGIDARLISQTGVGRYIKNILFILQQIDKQNEYVVYLRKKEYLQYNFSNRRWKKKLLDYQWHTLQEQIHVPRIILQDRLDVMHFPYFNIPFWYSGKYLVTIHDLIINHFDTGRASTLPLFFYRLKWLAYLVNTKVALTRASYVTVISKTTKKEILDHYRLDKNKIRVTYDALDENFFLLSRKFCGTRLFPFPYVLYVGNAYPHKNLERLFDAMRLVYKSQGTKLVLAGDDNYFYPRLKQYVIKIKADKFIVFSGMADDKKLISLYRHARCSVFPSLMEGFGLPNFEAIVCNCLPVISNIAVFREIWGSSLPMFNPYNPQDLAKTIIQTLSFPHSQTIKRIQEAQKIVSLYSWKKTAIETLAIYQKIVEE